MLGFLVRLPVMGRQHAPDELNRVFGGSASGDSSASVQLTVRAMSAMARPHASSNAFGEAFGCGRIAPVQEAPVGVTMEAMAEQQQPLGGLFPSKLFWCRASPAACRPLCITIADRREGHRRGKRPARSSLPFGL